MHGHFEISDTLAHIAENNPGIVITFIGTVLTVDAIQKYKPQLALKAKLNSLTSFFSWGDNERIAKANARKKACDDFVLLDSTTRSEIEDILLNLMSCQLKEGENVEDRLRFTESLNTALLSYPTLPNDVKEAAEIEDVIKVYSEHHTGIKSSVESYLNSAGDANESQQNNNIKLGV